MMTLLIMIVHANNDNDNDNACMTTHNDKISMFCHALHIHMSLMSYVINVIM